MWFVEVGSMSRDTRHAVILIGLGAQIWQPVERSQQGDHPIACNKQLGYTNEILLLYNYEYSTV